MFPVSGSQSTLPICKCLPRAAMTHLHGSFNLFSFWQGCLMIWLTLFWHYGGYCPVSDWQSRSVHLQYNVIRESHLWLAASTWLKRRDVNKRGIRTRILCVLNATKSAEKMFALDTSANHWNVDVFQPKILHTSWICSQSACRNAQGHLTLKSNKSCSDISMGNASNTSGVNLLVSQDFIKFRFLGSGSIQKRFSIQYTGLLISGSL